MKKASEKNEKKSRAQQQQRQQWANKAVKDNNTFWKSENESREKKLSRIWILERRIHMKHTKRARLQSFIVYLWRGWRLWFKIKKIQKRGISIEEEMRRMELNRWRTYIRWIFIDMTSIMFSPFCQLSA